MFRIAFVCLGKDAGPVEEHDKWEHHQVGDDTRVQGKRFKDLMSLEG